MSFELAAKPVSIRLLNGDPSEMDDLQQVLEEAPAFAYRVTGGPPNPADAQSTYSSLPDGKSYDDKFVFGIFHDERMIGCIDVYRNYPSPGVAWIGLLLLSERFHGHGFGRKAFDLLRNQISCWEGCDRIQLAVVSTNEVALPFWRRMGFNETGKRGLYQCGAIAAESVFMDLLLDPVAT
jgi:diamine N-acetyltransferase